MHTNEKQEIIRLLEVKAETLGSYNKVAKNIDVSPGTISNIRNNNWSSISDKKRIEIGLKLGYRSGKWAISTETRDYQHIMKFMGQIKSQSSFQIICDRAGASKTTGLKAFADNTHSTHYMSAREWGSRVFMVELMKTLGVKGISSKRTADQLLQMIIDHLTNDLTEKPMIIIDEADKLKPGAVRMLIYIFNALEDAISVVISGAEALRKHIARGVAYSHLGYDELESRFGRSYMPMVGANKQDVAAICRVNGVFEEESINAIWMDVPKTLAQRQNTRNETVVHDMRRLKKLVQIEQLKLKHYA